MITQQNKSFYDIVPDGVAFSIDTGEFQAETHYYTGEQTTVVDPYEEYCGSGWWDEFFG